MASVVLGLVVPLACCYWLLCSLFAAAVAALLSARSGNGLERRDLANGAVLAIATIVWYGAAPVTYLRYKHIPGARGAWLLGSLWELGKRKGNPNRILSDVYREHMQKYGKVFKFMFGRRMPMVIVVDPDVVQDIGMRKFSKLHDRPKIGAAYAMAAGKDSAARERIEKGLLFTEGGLWRGIRNACLPLFHAEVLSNFVPVMNDAAKTLNQKLSQMKDGTIVNIHNMFGGYTQEVIGTSVFGQHFDSQSVPETDGDTSIVSELSSMDGPSTAVSMYRAVATIFDSSSGDVSSLLGLLCPFLVPFLQAFTEYFPTETSKRVRKAILVMSDVGENMLNETKSRVDKKTKQDATDGNGEPIADKRSKCSVSFMERMLSAKDRETGRPLSDNEIVAQSTTFIAGGTETTASTLSYAVYLISQHPDVEAKIAEEADGCPHEDPSYTYVMENFKYIQAVIYETLRLYPSGGSVTRVTKEEVMIGGYKVPANTTVVVPLVLLQNLPEHFPEPEKFMPERFMTDEGDRTWHKYAYIPFGLGQRQCIGYKMAMAETSLALFQLYRCHTFRVATSMTPTPDLPLKQGLTLQPKDGVCVYAYHRQKKD